MGTTNQKSTVDTHKKRKKQSKHKIVTESQEEGKKKDLQKQIQNS